MRGRDIALETLLREQVPAPCINYSWMTNSSYLSKVGGRRLLVRPGERVLRLPAALRDQPGAAVVFPGPGQRKLEEGR